MTTININANTTVHTVHKKPTNSLQKIHALIMIMIKNMLMSPMIALGFITPPIMGFILNGYGDGGVFSFVVLSNILFAGTNTLLLMLVDEKEKNTLNVLIASSVSALDYLLSGTIITMIITTVINIVLFFTMGMNAHLSLLPFIALTTVPILPSAAIGGIIGILCNKATTASMIAMPVFLGLVLIPQLATGSFELLNYLFAGQVTEGIAAIYLNESILPNIGIMMLNFCVLASVFVILFKKRGLVQ